jgi:exodeoxyribonuclease VII small subunit
MTEESPSFEASLQALDRVVRDLESGGLGLDDALASYEKGIRLLSQCRAQLDSAERQVALLTGADDDGTPHTTPFDGQPTDAPPRTPGRKPPSANSLDDLPF